MNVYNIVLLSSSNRLTYSVEKELQIEMHIAYHLGILQKGFETGKFDENVIENINEIHFIVYVDNGHTLGFTGDIIVKHAKVAHRMSINYFHISKTLL